jgi:hypothetical protein
MLEDNPEKTISVRTLRIYGYFYAQIRERGSDMIWRTGEKTKSEISEQDAINIVFTKFLEKTGF